MSAAWAEAMIPIGRGRRLIVITGAWALAALPASAPAAAQDAPVPIIAGLQEQIRAVEAQDGENSPDLIQPFTALAVAHRERGEPALAIAALQTAVHLVHVNFGPHSLEQAPLIRQLITNAESLGDHWSAWQLERDLLSLARRHREDLGSVQILSDTADRRMDILAQYNAGHFPPEIVYGCYYSGPHVQRDGAPDANCAAGSASAVRQGLAMEAQAYYVQAANIILRQRDYSSHELPGLLNAITKLSYEYGDPSMGRQSLKYLLAYQTSNSAPWLDRIDTLVQIADWDLLHSIGLDEQNAALAEYAQAYDLLQRSGADEESVRKIFAPDTPVALPVSLANPFATEDEEAPGHIDFALELDKYGRCRHMRILDSSDDATRAVEKHVEHVLSQYRFRPRFVDGRVADRDRAVIRYLLND
jgi:hypothetical protein